MRRRMNDSARPERKIWHQQAAEFVGDIWAVFPAGYGFVAAREAGGGRWQEMCIPVQNCMDHLTEIFGSLSPRRYDFYFCPNAFSRRERRAVYALPTPYAWVDIDGADVAAFNPKPDILIRTSPGRHQGVWWFADYVPPQTAERYSRTLAYTFRADRNGWSATKYLRIPFTFNHKPEYDIPNVELLRYSLRPQRRSEIAVVADGVSSSRRKFGNISPADVDPVHVLKKYRPKLHLRTRALLTSKAAYAFEKDRSKCIYEIIVDLHHAGADPHEIGAALWVNPYFVSKHGKDLGKLNEEVWRVISKLERQP